MIKFMNSWGRPDVLVAPAVESVVVATGSGKGEVDSKEIGCSRLDRQDRAYVCICL